MVLLINATPHLRKERRKSGTRIPKNITSFTWRVRSSDISYILRSIPSISFFWFSIASGNGDFEMYEKLSRLGTTDAKQILRLRGRLSSPRWLTGEFSMSAKTLWVGGENYYWRWRLYWDGIDFVNFCNLREATGIGRNRSTFISFWILNLMIKTKTRLRICTRVAWRVWNLCLSVMWHLGKCRDGTTSPRIFCESATSHFRNGGILQRLQSLSSANSGRTFTTKYGGPRRSSWRSKPVVSAALIDRGVANRMTLCALGFHKSTHLGTVVVIVSFLHLDASAYLSG